MIVALACRCYRRRRGETKETIERCVCVAWRDFCIPSFRTFAFACLQCTSSELFVGSFRARVRNT
jgi:hypothetical protein